MTLAPYIHAMGRGPGRARSLTGSEAEDAMRLILSGQADPHAIGALLMLMRYRGETPDEIAGFTRAARSTLPALPPVDLDWPSYAAGRTRGLPWFLHAARQVAATGKRVLIHGWNSHQSDGADVRSALALAGITRAQDVDDAARLLDRDNIAYLPCEAIAPRLLEVLRLRDVLGLRTCINTVCRMLNPAQAPAAVQGVFHPPYLALQQAAGAILGQPQLAILKGGGGEFERNPSKPVTLWRLVDGQPVETLLYPLIPEAQRLSDVALRLEDFATGAPNDLFVRAIIDGTGQAAQLALPQTTPA